MGATPGPGGTAKRAHFRSRVLHEMAERFEAHAADLIQLTSIETGKVVPEATFEVGFAAPGLRYYGALA